LSIPNVNNNQANMIASGLILLRPATPADAETIGRIRVSAWRAAYQPFMPASYLASLDHKANMADLRTKLATPSNAFRLTIAEVDDQVVGFSIVGTPRHNAREGHTELWALNVTLTHWRKGIGRALTLQAIGDSAAHGFIGIDLWCIVGNLPAQAAYESCGFIPTGIARVSSALTGYPLHEILYVKSMR
jgi:RimJ/RimL family protein N-acetyltransferase